MIPGTVASVPPDVAYGLLGGGMWLLLTAWGLLPVWLAKKARKARERRAAEPDRPYEHATEPAAETGGSEAA